MLFFKQLFIATVTLLILPFAWGQAQQKQAHIGYVFPAGGQKGTVSIISVGGQALKDVDEVYVTGEGVTGRVLLYLRPLSNMQRQELAKQLQEIRGRRFPNAPIQREQPLRAVDTTKNDNPNKKEFKVELPDYPMFRDLENKSPRELKQIADEYLNPKRQQQPNEAIAETIVLEITIDKNADTGPREIRLSTKTGMTNPLRFEVGAFPEIREEEPNDPNAPRMDFLTLPVVINGQIRDSDVDRYRFEAKQGDVLVAETKARTLIPYLADAVPGWFQATLTLFNANGDEVAYVDDFRFDPDPILSYRVPEDGEYELEIRDAIYRGRDDFVYRVTLGKTPFVTGLFPLGGRSGKSSYSWVTGWNLNQRQIELDTQPGPDNIRELTLTQFGLKTNPVSYAVDTLPEFLETEPNNTIQNAQRVYSSQIVNGKISQPGDIDVFRYDGKTGETLVVDVQARRLQSPLDSWVQITNSVGSVLQWNDDRPDKEYGMLTHHADSFLMYKIPTEGIYYITLRDAQNQGGDAYAYRLRSSPPRPDFALRMTPSTLNLSPGRTIPVKVYAIRKEGFTGDISIGLKGAPSGFRLSGNKIPAGMDEIRMTMTAPWQMDMAVTHLLLEGSASVNGQRVSRPVVPSDDMMQAFAYHHLVPSRELAVSLKDVRRWMNLPVPDIGKINIPAGGSVPVEVALPPRVRTPNLQLKLNEPPKGISLENVKVVPGKLSFTIGSDAKILKPGYQDNLIIDVFSEVTVNRSNAPKAAAKQSVSLGALPAIPMEIIQPLNKK